MYVFAVDERYIAADHKDSINYLLHTTLLKNAKIPEANTVFPNCKLDLNDCVQDFKYLTLNKLSVT